MDKKYAKKVLEDPFRYNWYAQGFGKMATTIGNAKLHIWDRLLLNPRVPAIHSHSYDFLSLVVVGVVRNLRFSEVHGDSWSKVLVTASGELIDGPSYAALEESPIDVHREGVQYRQASDEVHLSFPDDGTMTLVEWTGGEPKHMKVYWRGKTPWVNAKSRPATREEIASVTKNALEAWY